MEDTAYRNACGHTDHENAVIEGNAAVRRAVLGSGNMQLLKQYSDVPEFRHRLHQEVIAETYPKLHPYVTNLPQYTVRWDTDSRGKGVARQKAEAYSAEGYVPSEKHNPRGPYWPLDN